MDFEGVFVILIQTICWFGHKRTLSVPCLLKSKKNEDCYLIYFL
jgi:hypothetical protein